MPDQLNLEMRGAGPRWRGSSRRRNDGTPSKRDTPPRRTTFWEDNLHVATIIEYVDDGWDGHDFCVWYTAGGGRQVSTFIIAEQELRADLLR